MFCSEVVVYHYTADEYKSKCLQGASRLTFISILQKRKAGLREVKRAAQHLTAEAWQSWDSNPGRLAPESMLLSAIHSCLPGRQYSC